MRLCIGKDDFASHPHTRIYKIDSNHITARSSKFTMVPVAHAKIFGQCIELHSVHNHFRASSLLGNCCQYKPFRSYHEHTIFGVGPAAGR